MLAKIALLCYNISWFSFEKRREKMKRYEINFSHHSCESIPEALSESHCHDFYEILFVVNGSGKYVVEGAEYQVAPRTLMLIRPFAYHHLSLDSSCVYERYLIHFRKSSISPEAQKLLENMTGQKSDSGIYYPPRALSNTVISVFDRLEVAESLPTEEREAYIKILASELIILLSASLGEKMVYSDDELGARVIRYLNSNIERDISLDKLSKRFFVSKYYLCRAFKKHNGVSVHGYINQKRIMYAKQLIESGETASGAAYKVGFGDYSAFYRAYVKIVGTSPTAEVKEDK